MMMDGAMGTMIQPYKLEEADYRGIAFADHGRTLRGCNDLLSLTRPDIIEAVHRAYIEAGVKVGLGTDNSSCSDSQNLFQAMKMFVLLSAAGSPERDGPVSLDAFRAAQTARIAQKPVDAPKPAKKKKARR